MLHKREVRIPSIMGGIGVARGIDDRDKNSTPTVPAWIRLIYGILVERSVNASPEADDPGISQRYSIVRSSGAANHCLGL